MSSVENNLVTMITLWTNEQVPRIALGEVYKLFDHHLSFHRSSSTMGQNHVIPIQVVKSDGVCRSFFKKKKNLKDNSGKKNLVDKIL